MYVCMIMTSSKKHIVDCRMYVYLLYALITNELILIDDLNIKLRPYNTVYMALGRILTKIYILMNMPLWLCLLFQQLYGEI